MPKLSVVMPVYNAQPFLASAIQSILDQTFTDFELIVIDDASTDDSFAIACTFKDTRVIHISLPYRTGNASVRNIGLQTATSPFFAWADADDISHPQRLEWQIQHLHANPNLTAVGSSVCFFSESKPLFIKRFPTSADYASALMLFHNTLLQPAVMFRMESLRQNAPSFFEDRFSRESSAFPPGRDNLFFFDLVRHDARIASIPQVGLFYRQHPTQLSSSTVARKEFYQGFWQYKQSQLQLPDALLSYATQFFQGQTAYDPEQNASLLEWMHSLLTSRSVPNSLITQVLHFYKLKTHRDRYPTTFGKARTALYGLSHPRSTLSYLQQHH